MNVIASIVPHIDQVLFERQLSKSKQLLKLFQLARDHGIHTNEEAFLRFKNERISAQAFKQLRLRLRTKLFEFLLKERLIVKNVDEYSQRHKEYMNTAAVVKYLGTNNARQAAVEIAEHLIIKTMKMEYTDLTILLSRELSHYYGAINYKSKKYRKYSSALLDYLELQSKEIQMGTHYNDLRIALTQSYEPFNSALRAKALIYSRTAIKFLTSDLMSFELLYKSYLVLSMHYEIERDHSKVIQVCNEAIEAFQHRRISRNVVFYLFSVRKIAYKILMKEYDEVENIIGSFSARMNVNSYNWYALKIYSLLNRLHSSDYKGAESVLNEVKSNTNYKKQPTAMLQMWTVYEAYVEFVSLVKNLKAGEENRFRLNKFLNEIPLYTKDKRGLNIAILIIQVLFLLQKRKYSQIIDRVDALQLYDYRYLRKDDTFRSHCFIRMLLQMPKADFNKIRTERYAEPYLRKLKSVPMTISQQNIEVEVIPYEDLWEMTLELLD